MILYLTNKVLTYGIIEISTDDDSYIFEGEGVHRKVYINRSTVKIGNDLFAGASDIFEDKKEAVKRAKQLVKNRVNFHKRKIKELENMRFE